MLGIWSPAGVMVAYKPEAAPAVAELETLFADLVGLSLTVNALMAAQEHGGGSAAPEHAGDSGASAAGGNGLAVHVARVRQRLTRPESQVLERFARAVRLFETLDAVRDANRVQAVPDVNRTRAVPVQAERMTLPRGARDVFICHAHADYETALAVCTKLEAAGVRCWIAPRDVEAGAYAPQLVRAISNATAVLLLYSSRSNASDHVLRELEIASSRRKIIVPLRLEDVPPSEELEYFTLRMHWLDALAPPLEARLDELTAFMQRLMTTQAATAPPATT
jgi:hypothetical protein